HVQVDPVQQRARDPRTIAADHVRAAVAAAGGVAGPAAGAGVHRGDELEPRRELALPSGPRDRDRARLQRLPQHLQRVAAPLGQLVQEQYPVVGQRDLARARNGRSRQRAGSRPRPAAEATAAASSAWAWSIGGSRPGRREASRVLPQPGGPQSSRWWSPAAAISSARRAWSWPRTSRMSGIG